MSTPHKCPICLGSGMYDPTPLLDLNYTILPTRHTHPCHGCDASGVVWDPPQPDPLEGCTVDPTQWPNTWSGHEVDLDGKKVD